MLGQVRRMLEDDPDLGNAEIRRRLGEAFGRAPAYATVKRLVSDSMRDVPPVRPFGDGVVLDAAGLDVLYDEGIATRLYAVLDAGTALVLGWEIWSHDDPAGGYARAAHHALFGRRAPQARSDDPASGLAALDLTGVRSAVPMSIELRVLPGDAGKVEAVGAAPGVSLVEDASLGRALVDAVGERIASVWMGTGSRKPGRSYRTGRTEEMPILTARLRQRIGHALQDHDEYRLGLMPRDAGDRVPEEVIDRIRALLLPVSEDADIGGLATR